MLGPAPAYFLMETFSVGGYERMHLGQQFESPKEI